MSRGIESLVSLVFHVVKGDLLSALGDLAANLVLFSVQFEVDGGAHNRKVVLHCF